MAIVVNGKKVAGVGLPGKDGAPGADGKDGAPGKSAYQAAKEKGYTGTEEEFNTALAGMQSAPFLPLSGGTVEGVLEIRSGIEFGYEITCETTGEAGNDYGATVIPIEYVDGLETCTITALLIPGEDEEDTEVFRQRYFNSLNAQAFGGNRIDYIEKVNAIPGVGGVKVYRAWNSDIRPAELVPPEGTSEWISGLSGVPEAVKSWLDTVYAAANNNKLTVGGTVKLVVIDSTFAEPSEPLVELVQTTIDPLQNAGEGVGIAPIGHVVKVYGVENETVNLSFTLTYQQEWGWEDVKTYVETTIKAYFTELAQTWADQEQPLVVRVSQIESRLLAVSGILDIADTKINGTAANYELALDHIPVLGTITPATGKQSA